MLTMPAICLLLPLCPLFLYHACYAYNACAMTIMNVLCLCYACNMPIMPVLWPLCLYYVHYTGTMPVVCPLCLFITRVPTMPIYDYRFNNGKVYQWSRVNVFKLALNYVYWANEILHILYNCTFQYIAVKKF